MCFFLSFRLFCCEVSLVVLLPSPASAFHFSSNSYGTRKRIKAILCISAVCCVLLAAFVLLFLGSSFPSEGGGGGGLLSLCTFICSLLFLFDCGEISSSLVWFVLPLFFQVFTAFLLVRKRVFSVLQRRDMVLGHEK